MRASEIDKIPQLIVNARLLFPYSQDRARALPPQQGLLQGGSSDDRTPARVDQELMRGETPEDVAADHMPGRVAALPGQRRVQSKNIGVEHAVEILVAQVSSDFAQGRIAQQHRHSQGWDVLFNRGAHVAVAD